MRFRSNTTGDTVKMPPRIERTLKEFLSELSACGHQAATLIARTRLPRWANPSLFFFLGYIARSEGRVTEKDIQFAETLMKSLGLSNRKRRRAIHHFHQGKNTQLIGSFRASALITTHRLWPGPSVLIALCLIHATQIDGQPSRARRHRCEDAIHHIGLPVEIIDRVLDSYGRKVWITQPEMRTPPTSLEQACRLLGVHTTASITEMKRAYRRKVSQCHPDKLGNGLSEREYRVANERLLRYQQAWDLIRRRRGRH